MKLNLTKTLLLGLGFLGVNAIWAIYNAFVPTLLEHKFGLSLTRIAFFMTLDNSLALVIQPPIGTWSDKLRTPIGRRMPFILVGAPLAALAFAWMPLAPILPLFVVCTVSLLASMALWRTPVMALMADVTPPELRSQVSGIVSFMGGVGSIIASFGGAYLAGYNAAFPFWLGSVLVTVAAGLLIFYVKEPPQYATEVTQISEAQPGFFASLRELFTDRNTNVLFLLAALVSLMIGYTAVEGFFPLYAWHQLGWDAARSAFLLGESALAFVVFAIPAGNLGAKFGRRRTIMLGLLMMAALIALIYFLPATQLKTPLFSARALRALTLMDAILLLVGLSWALVIIHPLAMLSNLVDNARLGTYTGLYYGFTSLAAIIGPNLNAKVVQHSGGDYNTVMIFAPFTFILAWALMWGVREPKLGARAVEIN